MRRGTTPTIKITIKDKSGKPFNVDGLADGRVTFEQFNRTVIEKKLSDCVLSDNTVSVTLTQKETLQLDASSDIKVQCKFSDSFGVVVATNIKQLHCHDILNEEVL